MRPRSPPKDVFDSVLSLEQAFYDEGVSNSQQHGMEAGKATGRDLGFKAGAALTAELEFYRGTATTILSLHDSFPDSIPARATQAARSLLDMCNEPLSKLGNDPTFDMDAHAAALRNVFRQMAAFSKLQLKYNLGVSSRMNDLSF